MVCFFLYIYVFFYLNYYLFSGGGDRLHRVTSFFFLEGEGFHRSIVDICLEGEKGRR